MQGPPGNMQGPHGNMQGPHGNMQGPPGNMQGPPYMQHQVSLVLDQWFVLKSLSDGVLNKSDLVFSGSELGAYDAWDGAAGAQQQR